MTTDEPHRNARPLATAYAARQDTVSQTSPGAVETALKQSLDRLGPGLVLDLGTGVGDHLSLLSSRGPVIGTDVSLSALQHASGAPRTVADGARLPFADGSFGAVVCTEVLEHVDDPAAVFAEMRRVLRPGGRMYVTTPNYANLAGAHKWLADRRTGRHDWNPWGAHEGGFEAFMTGRKLWRAARPHFVLESARPLDFGQAITGRFGPLDRMAWSRPGQAVLRRLLPRIDGRPIPLARWHGMHIELVARRRP